MNPKQIIAAHKAWRLFNRKGRVTKARLVKAIGRTASPTAVVRDVNHAYGLRIKEVDEGVFALEQAAHRGRKAAGKTAQSTASTAQPS